jgi:hypothetical protein
MRREISTLLFFSIAALSFLPDAQAAVGWQKLELVDATGVPNEPVHSYRFNGILTVWHSKTDTSVSFSLSTHPVQITGTSENVIDAAFSVQGEGRWNEETKEAEESLHLQQTGAPSPAGGEFASRLQCLKDPWIYPTDCLVVSAQYKASWGKYWDFPATVSKSRKPLTQSGVTLAKAADLSKRHGKVQETKWPTGPFIVTPGQNYKVLTPVKILVKPRDPGKNCTDHGVLWLRSEAKDRKVLSKPLPSKNCGPEGAIWALDLTPGLYQIRAHHTNTKYNFASDWSEGVTFEVIK